MAHAGAFCLALRSSFLLVSVVGLGAVVLSWQRPVFISAKVGSDADIKE